jgi:hypothetical protein
MMFLVWSNFIIFTFMLLTCRVFYISSVADLRRSYTNHIITPNYHSSTVNWYRNGKFKLTIWFSFLQIFVSVSHWILFILTRFQSFTNKEAVTIKDERIQNWRYICDLIFSVDGFCLGLCLVYENTLFSC